MGPTFSYRIAQTNFLCSDFFQPAYSWVIDPLTQANKRMFDSFITIAYILQQCKSNNQSDKIINQMDEESIPPCSKPIGDSCATRKRTINENGRLRVVK